MEPICERQVEARTELNIETVAAPDRVMKLMLMVMKLMLMGMKLMVVVMLMRC